MTKTVVESLIARLEGMPIAKVKISDILDDPMNPNVMEKAQIDALGFSMEKHGNVVPLVINKVKGMEKPYMVINGHQRLRVLREKGVKKTNCIFLDMPLAEARAFGIALNRNIGSDDGQKLSNVLHFIFQNKKLDLLAKLTPTMPMDFLKLQIDKFHNTALSTVQEETMPEVPKSTKTKAGDIYKLGRHRIMCGDSRKKEDVDKLFDGKVANCINTDPPYGVNYQGKNSFLRKVNRTNRVQFAFENEEDDKTNYREFYRDFLSVAPLAEYNTIYIWMAGLRIHEVRMAFEDTGVTWGDYLIWVKNHFVMSRKDYKPMCEFAVYGWKGKHQFYGEFNTANVFFENKPQVSEDHPTTKPIALIAKTILHGTKPGDIVYDAFGGSGTTLLACEENERTCYSMEVIPHFIDVQIRRWEGLTGKKAEKIG